MERYIEIQCRPEAKRPALTPIFFVSVFSFGTSFQMVMDRG